jgi:hypothetical protein
MQPQAVPSISTEPLSKHRLVQDIIPKLAMIFVRVSRLAEAAGVLVTATFRVGEVAAPMALIFSKLCVRPPDHRPGFDVRVDAGDQIGTRPAGRTVMAMEVPSLLPVMPITASDNPINMKSRLQFPDRSSLRWFMWPRQEEPRRGWPLPGLLYFTSYSSSRNPGKGWLQSCYRGR